MSRSDAGEITSTILSGATGLGGQVNLTTQRITGLILPATWVAAALSFQFSVDGTNWYELQTFDGTTLTAVTVDATTAAQGTGWIFADRELQALAGIRLMRPRSGLVGAAVNQTATRTLTWLVVGR